MPLVCALLLALLIPACAQQEQYAYVVPSYLKPFKLDPLISIYITETNTRLVVGDSFALSGVPASFDHISTPGGSVQRTIAVVMDALPLRQYEEIIVWAGTAECKILPNSDVVLLAGDITQLANLLRPYSDDLKIFAPYCSYNGARCDCAEGVAAFVGMPVRAPLHGHPEIHRDGMHMNDFVAAYAAITEEGNA